MLRVGLMSRARQRKADEEERRARENRRQEEFRRHVCAAPDHCFVPTQYPVGLGADVVAWLCPDLSQEEQRLAEARKAREAYEKEVEERARRLAEVRQQHRLGLWWLVFVAIEPPFRSVCGCSGQWCRGRRRLPR